MKSKTSRFLFWFPRIVAIVFIAFISMFSLDIFGNGYTFRQTVVGLFMHNIPSLVLTVILILSRKRYPLVGAIAFAAFGLRYTITNIVKFFLSTSVPGVPTPYYYLARPLIIALPSILIGRMFFRYRQLKRRGKIAQ